MIRNAPGAQITLNLDFHLGGSLDAYRVQAGVIGSVSGILKRFIHIPPH